MEKRSWNFTLGCLLVFLVMLGFSIHGQQKWQEARAINQIRLPTTEKVDPNLFDRKVTPLPSFSISGGH
ncbi:MAG TPA: hypothetical protein VN890_07375 [Methylocella sp.]|nr:hypothetical protein [Methylocella sp.]